MSANTMARLRRWGWSDWIALAIAWLVYFCFVIVPVGASFGIGYVIGRLLTRIAAGAP